MNDQIVKFMMKCVEYKKNIGIYVPSRLINTLELNKELAVAIDMHFYDDDINLHHKYLPGFDIKIENREEMLVNPPDFLLIMSYSFADTIFDSIKFELPESTKVLTINNFVRGDTDEYFADGF